MAPGELNAMKSMIDAPLILCVDDEKTGLAIRKMTFESLRARLFNPFVTTKEESGTGLGLWVCRSIVEKHGGSIRLQGSIGESNSGTTVSIFLPLRLISGKEERELSGTP